MNAATTNRFRGRAGRRIATAIVVAAALGLGATACGEGSKAAGAAGSSGSSAAAGSQQASPQASPPAGSTGGSSSGQSGSQGQNGGTSATASSAAKAGSGSGSGGGGHAQAGNRRTIVGKLEYLAPGKLIVKPQSGGMDQAFFVANATTVLGAAAICSGDGGSVSMGGDGYGTAKCTVEQLEKAAKTGSVTVRVTMDRKSGAAETVEEKYHP
ncbi:MULTISPECIES: hypothetical protein [unclassified Streptomyces]|uniref:hypothetical protein n=1 Tax=unclassified Streptomyces TaxID=2593676 RepID=UPI00088BB7A4|nr:MULTISPECIES: hypothetical protein [unclassified Streptomyces]PBC83451.1 hypothetical protein BX261_3398 [Streptomyces sp. 2321.6]SDR42238.1 hypothetical protein SAMN05216511_3803 [Streptomyces sp. KS_16]SEC97095.1 hypothetical protein SAMN05428940_3400 [Streptomyces sp. 2133.1]SNC69529.1 hypothetical protein SAMN06272741_3392 [Streptomyces sp. 2114.4]